MDIRRLKDTLAGVLFPAAALSSIALAFAITAALYLRARPILDAKPLPELLLGATWAPSRGEFGFFPFLAGTLYVTLLALAIAVPVSLLSAFYLAEYAPERLRARLLPLVDLLAGIPPVVYGVFGVLAVVPLVATLAPGSTGFSLLAGGLILAIMVSPILISVSVEVLRAVPSEVREASLSLGATRWQTVKHAVARAALPGLGAAVILGFSRAFGETMAVLMVVGNVPRVPSSVFDPAYPLPALIANNYGEMLSIPLYDSALLLAALVLLAVILGFTLAARLTLARVQRRLARG